MLKGLTAMDRYVISKLKEAGYDYPDHFKISQIIYEKIKSYPSRAAVRDMVNRICTYSPEFKLDI